MRHSRLNGLKAGEKICLFERAPRRLFIFLLLLCDSYLRSAPFRLNAVKHWIFKRAPRRLLLFDLKDAKENSGGAVLIKCVFSSCVVPESVGFVSWSVCACTLCRVSSDTFWVNKPDQRFRPQRIFQPFRTAAKETRTKGGKFRLDSTIAFLQAHQTANLFGFFF